jgi:hypothetical protein
MRLFTRSLLLLVCSLLICSCSERPEKKLLGRWVEVGNPKGALVFSANHSGRAFWPDEKGQQQSEEMKWEILEGGKKVSVITQPGPVYFEIRPDSLVAPNGVLLKKE